MMVVVMVVMVLMVLMVVMAMVFVVFEAMNFVKERLLLYLPKKKGGNLL